MKEEKVGIIPAQTIGYGERHKIKVTLPYPIRKGVCESCGSSIAAGEIHTTQMHHWVYAYQNDTVKANPMLVLENTVEVCFTDHQIADGLRMILRFSPKRIVEVAMLMEKWDKTKPLLKRLEEFCFLFLRRRGYRI